MSTKEPKLLRNISLPMLVFYGLGNIFGAGIYVLVGKMADIAGMYVPFSFLVACVVVFFTALSYAELSARYPFSAGEAKYVNEGFGSVHLSTAIGLLIALAGLLSSATILHGFHGYLSTFVSIPKSITVGIVIIVLSTIAIWGIKHSLIFALLLTLVEMAGLGMVIYAGTSSLSFASISFSSMIPPFEFQAYNIVILGAFLAFYAFIGFEDMVNIAEEVKEPVRTMPRAIIITLMIATFFYIAVAMVSVLVVPIDILSQSKAPLAQVYESATGSSAVALSMIAMLSVINGALIQIIMVSRILYGMSQEGWMPKFLGTVHPKTHTPVYATLISGGLIFILTSFMELVALAKFTSFFILIVFTLVNLSLLLIKRKTPHPQGIHTYPVFVPFMAVILNILMLVIQIGSLI